MTVVIVYHHQERAIAEKWRDLLHEEGTDVRIAPIGYEIGSKAWKLLVEASIETCHVVVVLLTENARACQWVNWRVDIAKRLKKANRPSEDRHLGAATEGSVVDMADFRFPVCC